MKKILSSALFTSLTLAASISIAQSTKLEPVFSDVSVITATVESVDAQNRIIMLKDGAGNVEGLVAPKSVKNFDQIKKGDKFVFEYTESIAVGLTPKTASKPGTASSSAVTMSAKGKLPFAETVDVKIYTAKIMSIDVANRTAALQLPNMKTVMVKIDKQVQGLDKVKVGDELMVELIEKTAIGFVAP